MRKEVGGVRETCATLQPLVGVLRVHPQGGRYQHGSPYDWSATASFESEATIRLHGAHRAPCPSQWRAIRAELRRWGCRVVVWDRYTLRGHRPVSIRIDEDR